jgi:DNA-directed RNA polymerase subunit RPC12/RpoP
MMELFCPECHRGIEFRLQLQTLNVTVHRDPNKRNKQSSSVRVSPTGTGENHSIKCPNCNKMILFAWRTSVGTQLPKPANPGEDVVKIGIDERMYACLSQMFAPSQDDGFIDINQDNVDNEDRDMKPKASK